MDNNSSQKNITNDYENDAFDTQKHNALLKIRSTYQNYISLEKNNTNSQVENQTQAMSTCDYFRKQIKQIHRSSSTLHNDVLKEYLNAPNEDTNVLAYWKLNLHTYDRHLLFE
ncbi:7929_t:CDS:2 [Dentiscutata erythropus]|uniref:7929_t:CDS:1 n=1 Tax=Dentiscutata erythropus TaxID=1348616 RepID=A0A9N8ZAK0_9GLOM|nr:7929_t:CDS:2 [Dentiscutata erythropus]